VSGNNCDPPPSVNTGFMLAHHDAKGQTILKALLGRTRDSEFVERSFWWDQHAVIDRISSSPHAHGVCITSPELQWFATTQHCMQRTPGAFMVHWPSTRGDPNAWHEMFLIPVPTSADDPGDHGEGIIAEKKAHVGR